MEFNLADILKGVSNSDTGREQIEYIPLTQIDEDPNNFYQLSDIPELADNIALCGLQQPIRVRQKEDGRYIIVSGHRRRAALEALVTDGYEKFREVPCIVELDPVSPSLQQLRLIYANSSTRKMTSAETAEQAERVTDLLYKLKEEGYEFPGRMRDHVAEAMKISKTKLARLKVIRENLDESWVDSWKSGSLTEAQAYALAQMPPFWQSIIKENWAYSIGSLYADRVTMIKERFERIQKIPCEHGLNACEHSVTMMGKSVDYNGGCYHCCFACNNLQTCKNCCPEAAGKKKELRDVARAANQKAKAEQEERDRPGAEFARLVWERIGNARIENRVTVQQIFAAQKRFYSASIDDPRQRKMETGNGMYSSGVELPFGYGFQASTMMTIRDVADTLGCSVDYLLGRTDRMEIVSNLDTIGDREENVPKLDTIWRRDDPEKEGTYLLMLKDHSCDPTYEEWQWDGQRWKDWSGFHNPNIDGEIIGWIPMPGLPVSNLDTTGDREDVPDSDTILYDSCITGMSPTGYCGAAAYCNTEHTCCLQCYNTSCNGRCGWATEDK